MNHPHSYLPSDEVLHREICERLRQADLEPSDVRITVVAGKVTLEGTVPDSAMKQQIEDLVDEGPGVQAVDNRIRVKQ